MRVAVIGAGTIGNAHAQRLNSFPEVSKIEIGYWRSPEKAQSIAGKLAKAEAKHQDEIFSSQPEAMVITSATASHAELLTQAIKAKIPVYCEKPIALDLTSTAQVVRTWETYKTPVQIGFQRRFDSGYQRAKEAYQSGELGFVALASAATLDEAPPPATFVPTSGGILVDMAVHDFDILRWVTGQEAVSIFAQGAQMGASYFAENNDYSSAQVLVTYQNGMTATISLTRHHAAGHDVRLELFGEKQSLFVGLDDHCPIRSAEPTGKMNWQPAEPYHTYNERFAPAFEKSLKYFLKVAKKEADSPCTPLDALESLRLATAAKQSLETGKIVNLENFTW